MKKVLISCMMAGLIFSSCEKNEEYFKSGELNSSESSNILIPNTAKLVDDKSARPSYLNGNEEYEEFARIFARSLKEKSMRDFLKGEANKKFDGDFDILFKNVKNNSLIKNSISLFTNPASISKVFSNEKLNISIPANIEKWDLNKEVLVAVSIGANEKTSPFLIAYDSKGKKYQIDAQKEPNLPVIVIGNNERTGKMNINNNKNLRTSGNFEVVTYCKVLDLSAIEKWWNGGPEMKFDGAVYFDNQSGIQAAYNDKYWLPSRSLSTSGQNIYLQLFQWFYDTNQGPDYHAQVYEEDDSNSTSTFQVGVTLGKKDSVQGTGTYTYTYKSASEKLMGELLNYQGQSPRNIQDAIFKYTISNLAP